jgi:hypothetical protein
MQIPYVLPHTFRPEIKEVAINEEIAKPRVEDRYRTQTCALGANRISTETNTSWCSTYVPHIYLHAACICIICKTSQHIEIRNLKFYLKYPFFVIFFLADALGCPFPHLHCGYPVSTIIRNL